MAELIYRIPSKIPYGYVEWRGDPNDPMPDPETLARGYVEYFTAYRKAEEAALTAPNSAPPKSKPAVQVSIADIVNEITEDEAKDLIVRELGGVPVPDEPWNNKPEVEAKPWTPPASADAWDFS